MNNEPFIKAILKIFILSFLVVFVGSILSNHKTKLNFNFFKKTEIKKDPTMEIIKSSLRKKENKFHLKKQSKIIKSAYADALTYSAKAYLIADYENGEIIAEKNSETRLPIASLTKIMTAIVALDLVKPTDNFIISKTSEDQMPTKIGITQGEEFSLNELLSASLMTSANDATQAIMEGVSNKYDHRSFIRAMNLKAIYIGLHNTSFENPQGFDASYNFSTARDLAVISRYALTNYPLIRAKASQEYELLLPTQTHKKYDLQNWNGLLGVYPGTMGLKIGNTQDAGKTTIAVAKRNGKTLIAVVLGANSILERDMTAANLLDYGFEKTSGLNKISLTETDFRNKYSRWSFW